MSPYLQFLLLILTPPALGFLIAPALKRHQDAQRERQRAEDDAFFNRNRNQEPKP